MARKREYNINLVGKRYVITNASTPSQELVWCTCLSAVLEELVSLGLDKASAPAKGQQLTMRDFFGSPSRLDAESHDRTQEPALSLRDGSKREAVAAKWPGEKR